MLQRSLEKARARRSDEGFTLIELLIVIIILGILAAIVVFSVSSISDKGRASACKSTVETINTAIEADYAKNSTVATTIGQLVSDGFLHSDSNFTTSSPASVTVGTGSGQYTVGMLQGTGTTYSAYGTAGAGPVVAPNPGATPPVAGSVCS